MDNLWIIYGSGWWLTYPSEKYESIGMMTFPVYGKIKNVPNHQPVLVLVAILKVLVVDVKIWQRINMVSNLYEVYPAHLNYIPLLGTFKKKCCVHLAASTKQQTA